jgi:hypothetical protein
MPMMFFYFLKIIFDISTSKRSKNYKPHSILAKKKKFKFSQNTGRNALPNAPLVQAFNYVLYEYLGLDYSRVRNNIIYNIM